MLSGFQSTGSTTFQISFANLPAHSYELKITRIYLNLLGATSAVPSLSGTLTHSGYAQALRRDGATLLLSSQPMTSFVSIGLTSGQVPPAPTRPTTGQPDSEPPAAAPPKAPVSDPHTSAGTVSGASRPMFYGRSPATTWSFTITDPTAVDLTGLTEVQVGLEFLAIAGS